MQDEPQRLRRGLFGYRAKAVRRTLADREMVLRTTQQRADAAQETVQGLRTELASARGDALAARADLERIETKFSAAQAQATERERDLAVLRSDIAARDDAIVSIRREVAAKDEEAAVLRADLARLGEELAALRESASQNERATVEYLMREVGPIIAAAEESARRISERARRDSDRQVEETYRLWRSMQGELARFGMWRDQIEELVASSRQHFELARARVANLPDRIAAALGPVSQAIEVVNVDLDRLARTSIPTVVVDLGGGLEEDASGATKRVTLPEAHPAVISANGSKGNGRPQEEGAARALRARLDWKEAAGPTPKGQPL